ncbi:NADH dehydrogenase [bacterium HR19]|nr:NADH dehydrogenase [bacterium HR19]
MFLNEKDRDYLRQRFSKELEKEVTLKLFTQAINCEYCLETEELLKELAETSDKIKLEIINFAVEKQKAEQMKVDKVPAIMIGNERIRFFGIPAGYEFAVLIEDIIEISKGVPFLSPESARKISRIKKPVNIKVFVTPTCPYCPRMAKYAHSAALINEMITAETIEATEFPELATAYSVYGVPKTIINDTIEMEGAVPEEHFVNELLRTIDGLAE